MIVISEVGCIFRLNEHATQGFMRTELLTETKDGHQSSLLPLDGYRTTLEITDVGFTVTSQNGEVVRRGTDNDVFRIYDSMLFKIDPAIVEASGETVPYADYKEIYGGCAMERTNRRKFIAYVDREAEYAAIGIIEYDGPETLSIASLYSDVKLTNRQAFDVIAEYVDQKLSKKDYGIVSVTNVGLKPIMHRRLAEDAAERKGSVTEILEGVNDDGPQEK